MNRLTTVASFDIAVNAQIARNVLEAAGIPAVVHDEGIVAMDWLLSNAVGGIKVQVREEDADRAAAVLDEKFGASAGLVSEAIDEDELTRQALKAGATEEEPDAADRESEPPPAQESTEEPPTGSEREEYARRLFYTAVFSILFLPLWFYAFYLMLNALFGSGPLTRQGRRRMYLGALFVSVPLLFWMVVLAAIGGVGDLFPIAW